MFDLLLTPAAGLGTETFFSRFFVFVGVLADAVQGETRRRSGRPDCPEGEGCAGRETQREGKMMAMTRGTGHFVNFGTTSIPVPDTSVTSVRHQYRYRTLR